MASVYRTTYKTADGKKKKSSKLTVKFRDHTGAFRKVPGFTDKKLSEELGRKLERLAQFVAMNQPPDAEISGWLQIIDSDLKSKLARWKMLDPRTLAEARNLTEHIADYRKHLAAKNNSAEHTQTTIARIESIVAGCKFVFLSDIKASMIPVWLADQRAVGEFGISTSNAYLTAFKGFCRWLVKDRRTNENPVAHLDRLNAEPDIRRCRRSLSRDDFQRLIAATIAGKPLRGISGPDRAVLYTVAAFTGLRASELASLTDRSFDFATNPPTVTVEAGYSKHRRKDVLPLHNELAARIRVWIEERDAQQQKSVEIVPISGRRAAIRLWPSKWAESRAGAKMLRKDLANARAAWINEADSDGERKHRERSDRLAYEDHDGRVFDFHALRGQFITELGRAGVSLQEAQKLARHSDPKLTANHYTHLSLTDLSTSVGKLPTLPAQSESLRATGTTDAQQAVGERENNRLTNSSTKTDAEQCRLMPKSGRLGKPVEISVESEKDRNPFPLLHLKRETEIIGSHARVAELADALDLGSSVFGRAGSSPVSRILDIRKDLRLFVVSLFLWGWGATLANGGAFPSDIS